MANVPKKRAAPLSDEPLPPGKRQRTGLSQTEAANPEFAWIGPKPITESALPSKDEQARDTLRRSIILALRQVGFDSASDEALESFTLLTETYLQSLSEHITRAANASRRAHANPTDFEASLWRHNLSTTHLEPHLKTPIPKSKLQPKYFEPLAQHPPAPELPILGRELSGQSEKASRKHIPPGFPSFPSIHTYRFSPQFVEDVTVRGTGLKYDSGEAVGGRGILMPDGPRGDAQKIREAAAQQALQAQEALGGLMRAGKNNQLKEIRQAAEKNTQSKERHSAWREVMEMVLESTGSKGKAVAGSSAAREEIADYSMMVNAQKGFHRKEIHRGAKKRTPRA